MGQSGSKLGIYGALGCLLLTAASACGQTPAGAARPFDWGERWEYYVHRTYSWQRLSFLAADTGLEHLTGDSRRWGRQSRYLGYRFAGGLGRRVVGNSIELGLGAAFDENARFRPSHARGMGARLRYAAIGSVAGYRGERRVMAYSRLAATVGAVLAVSLWDPQPLTTGSFFGRAAGGYVGHLENSFLVEFSGDLIAFGRRMRTRILRQAKP